MVSQMDDVGMPTGSDGSSDSDEITPGAAAGNAKATKAQNKKVVGARDKAADAAAGNQLGAKSRIQMLIEEAMKNDPNRLSLAGERLQNLGDLQKMPTVAELQWIDISKNYLDTIDPLNQLQRLKHIVASDNYIRAVNLQLPRLQELDLRNNFIEKVPILSQMPQLKVLVLNANNIAELKLQCKRDNHLNIMKMVFRNNRIKFTNMEVISFARKLKEFKALRVLNLENNPFEKDPQINAKIIRGLPQNLEMYNNQKKIYVQGTIAKTPDGDAPQADALGGDAGAQGDEEVKTGASVMPTLEALLYNLEAANSHPNKALEFLKQLYVDADRIKQVQATQSQSVFVQSFTKAKDTHTIKENIETFMQHAQLLVDNHFELRSIILSILSKLTIIRSHDFGVKCFYTLRDLMVAGAELEEQVMEQLNSNVIKEMNDMNPNEIPVSILIGLKDLVEKQQSHQTNLMSQLFERFFPRWLKEIQQQFFKARGASRDDESDQTDAILALLTASLRDDEFNVTKMYENRLHERVAEIFLKTGPTKSRYIHLLECMHEIAKMHRGAASSYIDKFIHRELMQEIKLTFYSYKKSQTLAPADNKDNVALIVKMYKVFSAQISLVASLLNAEERQREQLLEEPLIKELLQVLTHSNTDPILLTSICYLAEKVLNCDSVRTNPRELGDKITRMQSCENLLPYLGMGKYRDLLRNAQKYSGQEDQVVNQDGNEGALEYLNDPIIHQLFIQIIKLIEFFCRELALLVKLEKEATNGRIDENQRRLKQSYQQVCSRLNEADREQALFKCLEIPNDDVRLAVVHCLYYVPIEEIDAEEIDQLLKLMSPQNIGAGKTELVLAVIFNILSNLLSDNSNNIKTSETTTLFKTKFSFTAISLAIAIMTKNQEREVDCAEEEFEKSTLALSILNFLKHVSKESKTKDQLKNKGDVLKRILYSEQAYTRLYRYVLTPVEVETTQLGMDFESLRAAIQQGYECIDPYTYVSFRILHQMANLLQSEKPVGTYDPFFLGENDGALIIRLYQENLDKKIELEQQFWRFDQEQNGSADADSEAAKEHKKHHKVFTKKNGVKGILHFLTAQRNDVDNWLRAHSDPAIAFAGCQDKHPVFGRGLKFKIKKQRKTEEDKLKAQERLAKKNGARAGAVANGKGGAAADPDAPSKVDRHQAMKTCFQEEELGSGFQITDTELYLASTKITLVAARIKKREQIRMGVQNDTLRSLSVAAFLRCLYASIDSAPNGEYHEQAIANLRSDKIFAQITQLCAATGWLSANLGSKYLQVALYITRVNTTKRLEDSKNLVKYEILSIVIKRVLGLLKEKIKNENHNQELTEDDQNLLCRLAVLCNQMVTQCTLFDFRGKNVKYGDIETQNQRALRLKMIDFLMAKLFPLEEVQILIDVLFQEMINAQGRLHGTVRENDQGATGRSTLEHTKQFLAQYLAYCEKNKYQVLQYMVHNVVFVGKGMRDGFLEEIVEGTNAIQLSHLQIEQMSRDDAKRCPDSEAADDVGGNTFDQTMEEEKKVEALSCRSLAYQQKQVLNTWLENEGKRENEAKVKEKEDELDEIGKDCSLGERILFAQPMPCHVQFEAHRLEKKYQVFSVILTDQGVYVIDDEDASFDQDPADREVDPAEEFKRMREPTYKGPKKIERFRYSAICSVSYSYRINQRIVLKVEREKEWDAINDPIYPELAQGRGVPQGGNRGGPEEETKGAATPGQTPSHPDIGVKRGGRINRRKPVIERLFVTFVVPNLVDSVKMRTILDGAVIQAQAEADEDQEVKADEDLLLNYALLEKILDAAPPDKRGGGNTNKKGQCPLCHKSRLISDDRDPKKCDCDYHVVYAFRMRQERALKVATKSKQRGGPSRVLHTPVRQHLVKTSDGEYVNLRRGFAEKIREKDDTAAEPLQPEFGLLLVSPQALYFCKEQPAKWRDYTKKTTNQAISDLFVRSEEGKIQTQGGPRGARGRDTGDVRDLVSDLNPDQDKIEMKNLVSLRIINGRVPALELEVKRDNKKKKVWFSMMSDYNVQDTLMHLKRLKKSGGGRRADEDD